MNVTQISDYGEFGLIKHLTENFPLTNASSLKGIGDDAAVIDNGELKTLVTTDILLEGIHFNLEYVPLRHLGYKAAVVNFSDIYAMNGKPEQIVVSLGVSARFSVEMLEELYDGIRLACQTYGVDLVGGDTSSSLTGLTISVTCIGSAKQEEIVYRNGAKDGDLLCVSGNLGAAYLGLQLLERERIALKGNTQSQPDFAGFEYLLQRQLKPEARKDIIDELKAAAIMPTAMMDVSDGLSSEVMHICTQSGVGCRL
ncbi:MAG TPA: thiamine-phosphate kinase, partial [Bacteroidales bacterium]|nr:thiamine-phosphate kinase [Bacteroidales bacterium]